jgi:hypothetical protein
VSAQYVANTLSTHMHSTRHTSTTHVCMPSVHVTLMIVHSQPCMHLYPSHYPFTNQPTETTHVMLHEPSPLVYAILSKPASHVSASHFPTFVMARVLHKAPWTTALRLQRASSERMARCQMNRYRNIRLKPPGNSNHTRTPGGCSLPNPCHATGKPNQTRTSHNQAPQL